MKHDSTGDSQRSPLAGGPGGLTSREELRVCVDIAARVETVWEFLSDGAKFARWIGAFAGGPPLPGTAVDARVGGEIRVQYPGETATAIGVITEMEPHSRVAFTWGYSDGKYGMAAASTRVEITLTPIADGTRVELRHTGLPTEDVRRAHEFGWTHYLSMLAREGAAAQHAQRGTAAAEAFFRAWSEKDDAARLALLERCCEGDVRMRSAFACTNDVAALSAHIANGQRHMPGMTLRPDGGIHQLHGYLCADWLVAGPDGAAVMRGTYFMALSLNERLSLVVSFPAAPKAP